MLIYRQKSYFPHSNFDGKILSKKRVKLQKRIQDFIGVISYFLHGCSNKRKPQV